MRKIPNPKLEAFPILVTQRPWPPKKKTTMENQLIMEKENSVWTKTQLLVFYVIILLAIDE
jgi:hypothetical protein